MSMCACVLCMCMRTQNERIIDVSEKDERAPENLYRNYIGLQSTTNHLLRGQNDIIKADISIEFTVGKNKKRKEESGRASERAKKREKQIVFET